MSDTQVTLKEALDNPLWKAHKLADTYKMDGKGRWRLAYYPIMADGKTQEPYGEPRALMEDLDRVKGRMDLREVPLRYIEVN